MEKNKINTSFLDLFKEIENENNLKFSKDSTQYWDVLSDIVLECKKLRKQKNISQKELADLMKTKQSVISRFENMGRTPNYDFLVRLSKAFECEPKFYLDGKYTIKVPYNLHSKIDEIACKKDISITKLLLEIVRDSIEEEYFKEIGNNTMRVSLMENINDYDLLKQKQDFNTNDLFQKLTDNRDNDNSDTEDIAA